MPSPGAANLLERWPIALQPMIEKIAQWLQRAVHYEYFIGKLPIVHCVLNRVNFSHGFNRLGQSNQYSMSMNVPVCSAKDRI